MNRGRTGDDGRSYSTPRGRGRGRGRSSRSADRYVHRQGPAVADGCSSNASSGSKDGGSHPGWRTSLPGPVDRISKQFDSPDQQDCCFSGTRDISSDVGKLKLVENLPIVTPSSAQLNCMYASVSSDSAFETGFPALSAQSDLREEDANIWRHKRGEIANEPPPVGVSGLKLSSKNGSQCEQTPHKKAAGSGRSEISDSVAVVVPFDICRDRTGNVVMLKAPLHVQNKIKRNEAKLSEEGLNKKILRSGMLLLKKYISFADQIKIVKKCRDLGLGSGGFYEPGYRDGGKLHLRMMCLGKNWDPETSMYGDQRPVDGARPPLIPGEFCHLVNGAIQVSHSFIREHSKVRNVENVLPSMSPNLCIVNFYTKSGRLGLHQDKDESSESLKRRLPVVSFSIGDSAEFLYSDQRDPDKAEKVILESGDVLIFGGESRHIFHGVTAIHPDTAPKPLLEETNMLPGRLNLTFREY